MPQAFFTSDLHGRPDRYAKLLAAIAAQCRETTLALAIRPSFCFVASAQNLADEPSRAHAAPKRRATNRRQGRTGAVEQGRVCARPLRAVRSFSSTA